MKNRILIYILFLLVILSIIIIFLVPSINKVIAQHMVNQNITKEPIDPYKEMIQELQGELQRTDLPPDARNFAEEKLNIILMEATERALALVNQPTRAINPDMTPLTIIGLTLPDGINNTPEASFSRAEFMPLNSWRKHIANHLYLVFAGYLTEDILQGAIYVFHPNTTSFSLYVTPDRIGAIRVIAENGTTITLQSTNDTLFYFNAVIEQFVNAQGTPLPATPAPFNSSPSTPIPYP